MCKEILPDRVTAWLLRLDVNRVLYLIAALVLIIMFGMVFGTTLEPTIPSVALEAALEAVGLIFLAYPLAMIERLAGRDWPYREVARLCFLFLLGVSVITVCSALGRALFGSAFLWGGNDVQYVFGTAYTMLISLCSVAAIIALFYLATMVLRTAQARQGGEPVTFWLAMVAAILFSPIYIMMVGRHVRALSGVEDDAPRDLS